VHQGALLGQSVGFQNSRLKIKESLQWHTEVLKKQKHTAAPDSHAVTDRSTNGPI
jgi:hypothetical protein